MQITRLKKYSGILFLLVIIAIIFSSCSLSPRMQYLAPEYQGLKQSDVSLLLMPFITKMVDPIQQGIIYDKKNKAQKPINNKEIDVLENYMPPILSENTYAKIVRSDEVKKPSDYKLVLKEIEIRDGVKKELFVPTERVTIKGVVPEYLLLIEDLYFLKDAQEKNNSLTHGSATIFTMVAGIEYVLWDNKNEKIVGYGMLDKKMQLFSVPEKEDYINVLENFAISIINKSPLTPKKIYF